MDFRAPECWPQWFAPCDSSPNSSLYLRCNLAKAFIWSGVFRRILWSRLDLPFQQRLSSHGKGAPGGGAGVHPGMLKAVIDAGGRIGAEHRASLPRNGNSPQPQGPEAYSVPAGGSGPPHAPSVERRVCVRHVGSRLGAFCIRKMGGLSVTSIFHYTGTNGTNGTNGTTLKLFFKWLGKRLSAAPPGSAFGPRQTCPGRARYR